MRQTLFLSQRLHPSGKPLVTDSPFRVLPLPVAPMSRECIIGILKTREVEPVTHARCHYP